jgi:kinesin family protein 18/19
MPVEVFAPTKAGTPKRKKSSNLAGGTPLKLGQAAVLAAAPHMVASPLKGSPKRRKFGNGKKVITFSPRKSPAKPPKRGVRWRDEDEEGSLAEFEKTPQKVDSTPEVSSAEALPPPPPPLPALAEQTVNPSDPDSSPIPQPPEPTAVEKPKNSRFKSGFLSAKRTGTSPLVRNLHLDGSSDSEPSPLRDIEPGNATNRSSLPRKSASIAQEDGDSSGSEGSRGSGGKENADPRRTSSSDTEDSKSWQASKQEAQKIRSAVKRHSMAPSSGPSASAPALRIAHRRRSPTAADRGSSPPSDRALFTASHARRMVRSERESSGSGFGSVQSPRSQPVTKIGGGPARRMTMSAAGEGRPGAPSREGRNSAAAMAPRAERASLMAAGRSVWR